MAETGGQTMHTRVQEYKEKEYKHSDTDSPVPDTLGNH